MGTGRALTIARAQKRKKRIGTVLCVSRFPLSSVYRRLPSFKTLYYSFFGWNGIERPKSSARQPYRNVHSGQRLVQALRNNLKWTLIFVRVPSAVGLLIFHRRQQRAHQPAANAYRRSSSCPMCSFRNRRQNMATLFNPYYGIGLVFERLGLKGLSQVLWLGDPNIALYSVSFVNNWSWWGFVMVLFIAALQQIDPVLYEAAVVDGCSRRKLFWHVTLPGIAPTFVFVVMISLMWSMTAYDYVWVMTKGGPRP